jgi:hypothetical protein
MAAARGVLLSPTKPKVSPQWSEFGGASNLIAWRFRSCREALDELIADWSTGEDSHEALYRRDRALFHALVDGLSCIESTCYAIHALASHEKVLGLPFGPEEQFRSTPKSLRGVIASRRSDAAIVATLDRLTTSNEWKEWTKLRNRAAHRAALPRVIYGSIGGSPPPAKILAIAETSSSTAVSGDVADLEARFDWLSSTVRDLVIGGRALVS